MMSKELYIHVGFPKAGSTFIQNNIFPKMSSNTFCSDPDSIKYIILSYLHELYAANGLLSQLRLVYFKERFDYEFTKISQDKVLLSKESLSGFDYKNRVFHEQIIKDLHYFFPNAKIILVLREQKSWLISEYSLLLKTGALMNFNYYLNYKKNSFHSPKSLNDWTINVDDLQFDRVYKSFSKYFKQVYPIRFELLKENRELFIKNIETIVSERVKGEIDFSVVNKAITKGQLKGVSILSKLIGYRFINKDEFFFFDNNDLRHPVLKLNFFWKIVYIFVTVTRFGVYRLGLFIGKVLFKRTKTLYSDNQIELLNTLYMNNNKDFWNKMEDE